MYTIKNITYADAGYYLVGNGAMGFNAPSSMGPFTERALDVDNLSVDEDFIRFDTIAWANPGIRSYSDAKKFLVSKRYSNDDQIAIMLNKDDSEEDALAFEKMQQWREWASLMAHKIMEIINT